MNKVHLGVWNTIWGFDTVCNTTLKQHFHWIVVFEKIKNDIAVVFQAPEDTLTYEKTQGEEIIFYKLSK